MSSQRGVDYKNFRQISRDRLLHEMLRSTGTGNSNSGWKVLIMDKVIVKVMSYSCKLTNIIEEKIWSVEVIYKQKQPQTTMEAIYFIQPSEENVNMLLSDMRSPLYKKSFVFFSSPISKELVNRIKKDQSILAQIGALKEMNLEYIAVDSQGFITDHARALEDLYGDVENSQKGDACLNVMASRIATVFASLRELPFVRYRAAKSLDANTTTTFRDLVPTKLAAGVWNYLLKYKSSIPHFPQTETCELLILDRSVDQVPGKMGGPPEKKEVLLEDHDHIWMELCHAHIADASERLHEKMTSFLLQNKAAQILQGSRDGELSTRDMQEMVQALPQYSEQIDKISLHVEIAGKINKIIGDLGLRELGQLEQDIVFGDAGTKEVINFLRTKLDISRENKLRLLMIYAAVYPEKFEDGKGSNIMQNKMIAVNRSSGRDLLFTVKNMCLLEGTSDSKKSSSGAFSFLKLDVHKRKRAVRKDRPGEREMWQLSRFYPMLEDLVEKLSQGELVKDDYPCINDPSPTFYGTSRIKSVGSSPASSALSVRSRRTPTWARPCISDDGYSSDSILKHASTDYKMMGQRIFVFTIGGATRSELRVCHKLTAKLKREIVLGSTSLEDPPQFITKMKRLRARKLSLDDLEI